jgi:lysyl oxidase-like protein 2/3/4
MGASWVHGTEGNPIVQLAGEVGIRIKPLGEQTQVYGPSGDAVDDVRVEQLNDVIWKIISEAFGYSNKHCAEIPPDLSLKDFFLEHLPATDLNDDDKAFVMRMAEMWGSFIGDSWDKQSLKWFWLEVRALCCAVRRHGTNHVMSK